MRNLVALTRQWMDRREAVRGPVGLVRAGLLDLGRFASPPSRSTT